MRIAVDLDEVCYEWDRTARYMLREYRGCKGLESVSLTWDHIKDRAGVENYQWLFNEGVRLGLYRYGHCVKGSIIGLNKLAAQGHELIVVSHRLAAAVPDTLDWLAYNRVPWTEVHILSNGEPKSSIQADILVDDKPENLADWVRAGRKGIIYTRPWNWRYRMGMVHRAENWEGVVELVEVIGGLRPKRAG